MSDNMFNLSNILFRNFGATSSAVHMHVREVISKNIRTG